VRQPARARARATISSCSFRPRHQEASTSCLPPLRRRRLVWCPVRGPAIDPGCAESDCRRMARCMARHVPTTRLFGCGTTFRAGHGLGIAPVRPDLFHIQPPDPRGGDGSTRPLAREGGRARTGDASRVCNQHHFVPRARACARTGRSEGGSSEARRSFSPIPALPGEERPHSCAHLLQSSSEVADVPRSRAPVQDHPS
jgi:hypothetical protein